MPFLASGMDLEIIILNEVRERQISYHSYWNLTKKNDANELIYKMEIDLQISKTSLRLPKGKLGMNIHTHTTKYKIDNQ